MSLSRLRFSDTGFKIDVYGFAALVPTRSTIRFVLLFQVWFHGICGSLGFI